MIESIESILRVGGIGTYLYIGCDDSSLVTGLLKRSIDAYGMDRRIEVVQDGLQQAPGRFFQGSLTNYPLNSSFFDTIIIGGELLEFKSTDMLSVLRAVRSITSKNLILYFPHNVLAKISAHSDVANRLFWEKMAIAAGFRRHPRGMLVTPYHELENEIGNQLICFECIPEAANQCFTLDWLQKTRDLHMDMLREAGRRSDGHVSRYVHAAKQIRPNDIVLDAACGMGYGTAVLAACSPGSRFIGVDIDQDSIDYAQANYAAQNPQISYRACDVTQLNFLPDHSVDAVISFETIERIPNYDIFLAEVKRVLKPDGRFIGSVPNLWCDETGNDPNPHHFHVFDWNKLQQAVEKYFIVDDRVAQIAGGGFKMRESRRIIQKVNLSYSRPLETEWWLISACVDPLNTAPVTYTNPFASDQQLPDHINFAKYYDNPWLYRVMVQLGERLVDRQVLTDYCVKIVHQSRAGSADQGAALYVIGEQLLESGRLNFDEITGLINFINSFEQAADKNNPHVYSWLVSLHYLGGRLLLALGKREEALAAFLHCADMDVLCFSPLLAIKTISANMYAGLIYASANKLDEARQQFKNGVKTAHKVLQGDWKNIIGSLENPLPLGLQEMAQVLEITSQCAQAAHALERQQTVPGYFWDKINLKQFGLVEWNKDLERENAELRGYLQRIQRQATQPAMA